MNKVIIFTAPSGAGKTTLVKHLLSCMDSLMFSVSATTREKRELETDGLDYYFLTSQAFQEKINNEEFLEYEEVYKNQFYGTLKSEIERIWKLNKVVIFDVDVKGAINIKKHYGNKALSVFVKPPSLNILKQRLKSRATESAESLKIRLKRVELEMTFENTFDTSIINDDLDLAKAEAEKIVQKFITT